jgi:hypothetical protein
MFFGAVVAGMGTLSPSGAGSAARSRAGVEQLAQERPADARHQPDRDREHEG